jgi:tRNA dimethylallyltransferase
LPHLPSAPQVTLIAGPTASGKSALALEAAQRAGGVIINADSQQLYADLQILTARPSPADMSMVEHRLYGVADAADAWSVGRWSRAVRDELTALEADGRAAFIVGGTGLYFTALTTGLADIPQVPPAVRDEVAAALAEEGEAIFRRRLAERDPPSEARIASGDQQRLIRAMSVIHHTGRALSDWTANTHPLLPPGSWKGMVLEPERSALYARCDARVSWMVDNGALEEVRRLLDRGLDPGLPAMKAVGVREFAAVLKGEISLERGVDDVRQATRRYAKRQLTWFRNQTGDWPRSLSGEMGRPGAERPGG